jgi:hypothetical protein
MAWDKKDDVLGQIFDFIFAQQELEPNKRRPVNTDGVVGDKELIDAVSAILEKPAVFNVEHMAENYSDAVNIKLAELRFSEDNIKKAEFGTSNLADIITDPVGYARKIRQTNKAIRKSMRAKYLGAAATEFVVSAYLRKKGFSKELRDIIKNDTRFRDSVKELYEFSDYKEAQAYAQGVAHSPMLSGAGNEYVNAREAQLRAKMSMSRAQWQGLSDTQKSELSKSILVNEANGNIGRVQRTFRSMFGHGVGDNIFRRYSSNRGRSYQELEIYNLNREAGKIRSDHYQNGSWDSEEAELIHERTKLTKDFISNADNLRFISGRKTPDLLAKSRHYIRNLHQQIDDIKSDLKSARRRGDSSAERILKEQLKMTKATQRTAMQVNIVGNIGMIEGYLNSIRDYWNLQSVIKGDFFKSTKNQFYCPTEKVKFQWDGKVLAEYMIPAHHKDGESRNAVLKSYEEFFGRAYYFTPGAIFRTFFYNGEGFAWRAHLEEQKISEFLKNNSIPGLDLKRFVTDRLYRETVLNGTTGITNQRILDMLSRYSKLGDLTQMFSVLYRTQESLLKWTNEKIFNRFRGKVYDMIVGSRLFSRLPDGAVAMGLLKQWSSKGGLRNLIKGLAQGIAEALGIVAGPGLNLLIGAIASFAAEKLYDLAVPIFGVVVYAMFGIVGILVMTYGLIRDNSISYSISASTIPGEVGYCEYGDTGFYSDPTDEFWGTDILIPPPIDSSCPFGDATYGCSQGYSNTTCTHKNITAQKPVDVTGVTYFYAPKYCDSSNCTASTVINPSRCADGNYTGQWVTFNDGNGNVFTLGHTKFIPPSNGQNYKGGEPVAYVYQSAAELIADDPEQRTSGTSFYCWTGSHIHLLISQNGTPVDPLAFLAEMGCVNGPSSEAQCPACVGTSY